MADKLKEFKTYHILHNQVQLLQEIVKKIWSWYQLCNGLAFWGKIKDDELKLKVETIRTFVRYTDGTLVLLSH